MVYKVRLCGLCWTFQTRSEVLVCFVLEVQPCPSVCSVSRSLSFMFISVAFMHISCLYLCCVEEQKHYTYSTQYGFNEYNLHQ